MVIVISEQLRKLPGKLWPLEGMRKETTHSKPYLFGVTPFLPSPSLFSPLSPSFIVVSLSTFVSFCVYDPKASLLGFFPCFSFFFFICHAFL